MGSLSDLKKRIRTTKTDDDDNEKTGSLAKLKDRIDRSYDYGVDGDYINSFLNDSQKFINSASDTYNGLTYSNASSRYSAITNQSRDLDERASKIRGYINSNKDSIDEEWYKSLSSYLDDFSKDREQVWKAFYDSKSTFDKYDTEGDYNAAVMNSEDSTVEDRRNAYSANTDRIAELDKLIKEENDKTGILGKYGFVGWFMSDEQKDKAYGTNISELKKERDRLAAGNTKYERGLKTNDDYYDVTLADDWSEDSAKRDYANPTKEALDMWDARENSGLTAKYDKNGNVYYVDAFGDVWNDNWEENYKPEIVDKLGLFLNSSEEDKENAYAYAAADYESTWAKAIKDGRDSSWDKLTEQEIGIYYYLLENDGQDAAYKYLDDMRTELNRRSTADMTTAINDADALEKIALNIASVPSNIIGGLAGFIEDTANTLQGKDINPYSPAHSLSNFAQDTRSATAEDLNRLTNDTEFLGITLGDAYQSVMSAGDSAIGVATGSGVYGVLMGMGAATSEARNLYEKGASKEQIAWGGVLAGAAEMIFEKVSIDHFVKLGDSKTKGQIVKNLLKQGGVEASEEIFTEIANTITDAIVMGNQSEWSQSIQKYLDQGMTESEATGRALMDVGENVWKAGIGGFISGGLMGGVGSTASYLDYQNNVAKHGQSIIDKGEYDNLKALAMEVSGVTDAKESKRLTKLAGKASSDTTAKNVGRLSEAVENARTSANLSDITSALVEKGMSKKKAKKYAETLFEMNEQFGDDVSSFSLGTQEQWEEITGDPNAYSVLSEVVTDMNSSVNKRNMQHNLGRMGLKMSEDGRISLSDHQKQALEESEDSFTTEVKSVVEGDLAISDDGKTRASGKEVTLKGIDRIETSKDGSKVAYLKAVDSEGDEIVVSSKDVEYGSENEAILYETFVKMGIDPSYFYSYVGGFVADDFKTPDGKIADDAVMQYAMGFKEAVEYGKLGIEVRTAAEAEAEGKPLVDNSQFAYKLNKTAREHAFKAAVDASDKAAESKQEEVDTAVAKRKESGKGKAKTTGTLHYDSNKVNSSKRWAGVQLGKRLASIGMDVYFYESHLNSKGEYVDDNGELADNGYYLASDGSIHIDLNAGNNGQGIMVYTIAHELTHFMADKNPREFRIFADLLVKWYGKKGQSVTYLVKSRMAEEDLSWDDAFEEVIARSCESFLIDSDIAEKLVELEQTDKKTFQTIRNWIRKFMNWVRSLYADVDPETEEGQLFHKWKNEVSEIHDAFFKTLSGAIENNQWMGSIANAKTNAETLSAAGIEVDTDTGSAVMKSARYAPKTNAEIEKVAKALSESVGVSIEKARSWVKSETSLSSIILDPSNAMFLDYEADDRYEAIKKNAEYPQGTVDFSNLCKKRREFTALVDKLQKEYPNRIITAADLEKIRQVLIDENVEVACGLCYVEERRQLLGEIAQGFIDGYKNGTLKESIANELDTTDSYVPTIYDLITYDGYRALTTDHPSIANAFRKFNNSRGMQAGRLIEGVAEYKRDILQWSQKKVDFVNSVGGLRVFSFSDFEAPHLIDLVQVIQDCAVKGVMIQAYTKVPAFANAVKDTNVKVNRSLIAKGTGVKVENGKMVLDLDPVEGININDKDFFDSTDSESVGNVLVGMSDEQIRLAMKTPFVDYIIPFHTGLRKDILQAKKIDHWENYKNFQTDKDIATGKVAKNQINVYVDVIQAAEAEGNPIKNKVDFVNKFLDVAKEKGLKPRFWNFLDVDANGEYVYTEGYHKLLVDFKLFDKQGNILPQKPVIPVFDDALNARILNEYVAGKKSPVSRDKVYDRLVKEVIYNETHAKELDGGVKRSSRKKTAPTFYSYMGVVVDGVKQEKLGAASVINMLKEKGVKSEEIKWSGIETWLEGKKSVTKKELQEFIAGSMLQIEEQMSGTATFVDAEGNSYTDTKFKDKAYAIASEQGFERDKVKFVLDDDEGTYIAYVGNPLNGQILSADIFSQDGMLGIWSDYKLDGGSNYREIVFRMPSSSYSNQMMRTHWGDEAEGVLAHARVQDFVDADGNKMLFIEEIQSDWHNEGESQGYESDRERFLSDPKYRARLFEDAKRYGQRKAELNYDIDNATDLSSSQRLALIEERDKVDKKLSRIANITQGTGLTPDAPLRDTYHEFVLKNLIRMAAEEGYDSIGWTPAQIQSERWSDAFAEGFRIEYDKNIPKFLRKYGKKWGANVGKTSIDTGVSSDFDVEMAEAGYIEIDPKYTEVWSMDITESMKDSVLYEGQPMYSRRGVSNRSLLANALDSATQNDSEKNRLKEYKAKIDLINAEEQKLRELREKIKELSFAPGTRDTVAIKNLQDSANRVANRINTYDRQLLNLEATAPLKAVLNREKSLAKKRAEQKGKEALSAYRDKATKTQREIITRYQEARRRGIESRNKTEMRHKIKGIVSELNQLLLHGTKDKHIKIDLQKATAEALSAINMDTVNAEKRLAEIQKKIDSSNNPDDIARLQQTYDRIELQGENMMNKLTALKNAYEEIKDSSDPLVANAYHPEIEERINNLRKDVGDTPLREMTLEQLEFVYDTYKMVLTTIRNSNKAFKAKKLESIATLANMVMEEVHRVGGTNAYSLKGVDWLKKFYWNGLKPVYAFKAIGSETLSEMFDRIRAGEDTWAVDVSEAKDFFKEVSKKYDYDSWDFKKQYQFKSKTGKEFSLSIEQIMSLYAYSKRKQADEHLDKGGFVFDEAIEVKQKKHGVPITYKVNTATSYNLSKETLGEIVNTLTNEQKSFVDEMQAYLSDVMGAKGNEVSLEMFGVKLFKEKFYFPLKSAKQFMYEQNEVAGEVRLKNSGFSKDTVEHASNPIILSNFMDVWANHVNDMSMYHAFVLPLEDFNRVFNYKTPSSGKLDTESVKMYIQNAYGSQPNQYIKQLLTDLNGGARTDPTADVITRMMGLFKKAAVFASASVVIQQPSAIARAAAMIDTKYFATKLSVTQHKSEWAEVKKYAPVAIIKEMGYFDTNMGRSTTDFIKAKDYDGVSDKMKAVFTDSGYRDEVLSKAPAVADELSWCYIWNAVKNEIAATTDLEVGSEEFLKKCGERFTEVVVNTQVYDSVLSRSAMMRSKDTGMKMVTAFMAEPTTSINMIANAITQGKRGNKKGGAKAIGAVVASLLLNSILVSIVYAGRDDDEDKTYAEKYVGTLTREVIDSFNPLTMIPFVKDIISIAQGYDVERSDMAIISDLFTAFEKLSSDNLSAYEKVEDFGGAIASIFGLPVKNIMRDLRSVYNTINSFINGQGTTSEGMWQAVKEGLTGDADPNADQLYDAIIRGDKAHEDRVRSRYKDEKAVETAIRKALREHDPRIREAAEARNSGDIAEYSRIARDIISEGNFTQDTVVSAINAEINAINKETGSDAEDSSEAVETESESIYKTSDINMALEDGDTQMAKTVINDIVDTKVANGKTEKEAKSSVKSSITTYWKPLYLAAYKANNSTEMARIRRILESTGLYVDEDNNSTVVNTCQNWVKSQK